MHLLFFVSRLARLDLGPFLVNSLKSPSFTGSLLATLSYGFQ